MSASPGLTVNDVWRGVVARMGAERAGCQRTTRRILAKLGVSPGCVGAVGKDGKRIAYYHPAVVGIVVNELERRE